MLAEFWLGRRFFALFGVKNCRSFTGCNGVAYLPGIPTGADAAARFALFVFASFDLALSGFPVSVKLAVVIVVVNYTQLRCCFSLFSFNIIENRNLIDLSSRRVKVFQMLG